MTDTFLFPSVNNLLHIDLRFTKKIGLNTTVLLSHLLDLQHQAKDNYFHHSLAFLESYLGIAKKTILASISKLKDLGLLEVRTSGFPKKNYYKVSVSVYNKLLEGLEDTVLKVVCNTDNLVILDTVEEQELEDIIKKGLENSRKKQTEKNIKKNIKSSAKPKQQSNTTNIKQSTKTIKSNKNVLEKQETKKSKKLEIKETEKSNDMDVPKQSKTAFKIWGAYNSYKRLVDTRAKGKNINFAITEWLDAKRELCLRDNINFPFSREGFNNQLDLIKKCLENNGEEYTISIIRNSLMAGYRSMIFANQAEKSNTTNRNNSSKRKTNFMTENPSEYDYSD